MRVTDECVRYGTLCSASYLSFLFLSIFSFSLSLTVPDWIAYWLPLVRLISSQSIVVYGTFCQLNRSRPQMLMKIEPTCIVDEFSRGFEDSRKATNYKNCTVEEWKKINFFLVLKWRTFKGRKKNLRSLSSSGSFIWCLWKFIFGKMKLFPFSYRLPCFFFFSFRFLWTR